MENSWAVTKINVQTPMNPLECVGTLLHGHHGLGVQVGRFDRVYLSLERQSSPGDPVEFAFVSLLLPERGECH